jgi:uncharacterized protein YfaS (alpha-2-macroglobulin family)
MPLRHLPLLFAGALLACHGARTSPAAPTVAPPPTLATQTAPSDPAAEVLLDGLHERTAPSLSIGVLRPGALEVRAFPVALEQVGAFLREEFVPSGAPTLLRQQLPPGAQRASLDLSPALPEGRGILALSFGEDDTQLYVVSQISALLKIGRRDVLVWVTRALDGAPVAGADVQVDRCGTTLRGTSDANGLVRFAGWPKPEPCSSSLVLVRHEGEVTFVADSYGGSSRQVFMAGELGRGIPRDERIVGDAMVALFTERDWYRSGETLRYFGVARRIVRGKAAPLRGSVQVVAQFAEQPAKLELEALLSPAGVFSGELKVPGADGVSYPMLGLSVSQGGRKLGESRAIVGDVPLLDAKARLLPDPLFTHFELAPAASGPLQTADNWLNVRNERGRYDIGDVLRTTLASPFAEAFALLTVEREDVLAARVQKVQGERPVVELPLTAQLAPAVVLGVSLSAKASAGGERRHVSGSAYVPIAARYRLSVRASAKVDGEAGQLVLDVTDAQGRGKASELLVYAMDTQMRFNLFATDPGDVLFDRSSDVETLAPHFAESREGCDVEGDLMLPEQPRPSGKDGQVALQRIQTDPRGHATLALPAPPGKRTFAVFAIAASRDGGVGFAVTPLARD